MARRPANEDYRISDEDLTQILFAMAQEHYNGEFAPSLGGFDRHRPPRTIAARTALVHRGYEPDARNSYGPAWAELVQRLTGLEVFENKPRPQREQDEERKRQAQKLIDDYMAVASGHADRGLAVTRTEVRGGEVVHTLR